MIESFVDLTYRGLSLGRRVRLCHVRPRSGYLELPAPMPVGTRIAIAADDGTAFEATVTSIHEQVAGSDRAPGMTVAPALATDLAAAWWTVRVALPDDEASRPRTATGAERSQPATAPPRSPGDSVPPLEGPITDELAVFAGGATPGGEPVIEPVIEMDADEPDDGGAEATLTSLPVRRTGEHDVVDDGSRTTIAESIDLATLGIEAGDAAEPDGGDGGDGGDHGEGAESDDDDLEPTDPEGSAAPAGPARRRQRLRR